MLVTPQQQISDTFFFFFFLEIDKMKGNYSLKNFFRKWPRRDRIIEGKTSNPQKHWFFQSTDFCSFVVILYLCRWYLFGTHCL